MDVETFTAELVKHVKKADTKHPECFDRVHPDPECAAKFDELADAFRHLSVKHPDAYTVIAGECCEFLAELFKGRATLAREEGFDMVAAFYRYCVFDDLFWDDFKYKEMIYREKLERGK